MVSLRTKHLDKAITNYVLGKQRVNIVNIGSGYDSRFWRLEIANADIYEMDLPIMLKERKKIFNYQSKKHIQCVPIDLISQDLDKILLEPEVNFNQNFPTFFIWEGGSMYFDEKELNRIFSSISKMMSKDCYFWLDYVSSESINNETGIKAIEDFMTNMAKMGEPFINGFSDINSFAKKFNLRPLINEASMLQ